MDRQEKLTALFLYVNRHYESELFMYSERMSGDSRPEFSDTEVITVYLRGVMSGNRKVKSTHEYIRNHLSERFPKLPSYAFYIQRPNRISPAFSGLPPLIQHDFPPLSDPETIRLIDSVPIMIAKAQRGGNAKVAREIAAKGYNSTKKTCYYGLKPHVLAVRRDGRLPRLIISASPLRMKPTSVY